MFKKLPLVVLVLSLISPAIVLAQPGAPQPGAPQPRSLGALSTVLDGAVFRGLLQPGYHFNYKAPNKVVIDGADSLPTMKNPTRVEFRLQKKSWKTAEAQLYVCDDAVTYCETLTVPVASAKKVKLISQGTFELPEKETAKAPANAPAKVNQAQKNQFGFYSEGFEAALKEAKEKQKLLLVDFSAVWCPGCLRLEKEIFPLKAFQELTSEFVKVHLDTDRFENAALIKDLNVKGVPTLMVLTPDRKEVVRIYDYQPMSVWKAYFAGVKAHPEDIEALKEKATKNPELYNVLASRLRLASKPEEAISFFEKAKKPSAEYWDAKVEHAEGQYKITKNAEVYSGVLNAALKHEDKSSRSLSWRIKLLPLLSSPTEQKRVEVEGVLLANQLLKSESLLRSAIKTEAVGEFTGYEKFLIAFYRAELKATYLREAQKKESSDPSIAAVWKEAAKETEGYFKTDLPLGPGLRYLILLVMSGEHEKAEAIVNNLIQRNPENFDLQRRKLRILVELKKHEEALKVGQEALKNSFGKNEFWTAEQIVKAHLGLGQKKQALSLVQKYLKREELNAESMKSTRETFAKFSKELS